MSSNSGLRRHVFVFLFLSIIGDVSGVITFPPSNAVAEVGQHAIFNCTSGTNLQHWALTTKREDLATAAAEDIALSCVVQPGFATHYEVDRPGGNNSICNLIVKDVTMQQAGVYTCSDTASGPSAILTVIDSSPNMTFTNTTDVVEGDNVVFSCSLNYSGPVEPASTLRPHFYWTDHTGKNVSSFYNSTPVNGPAISQIQHTAGRQDIMPFTCHVYLQLISSSTPGYVNNTPSVNSSASSPPIAVLYPVGAIVISSTVPSEDNCVSKLETLTCTADANPPAEYVWLDLKNNTNTTGANKNISSGGDYQCTASNSIRNQKYYETKNITKYYCYSPYNLTINGTDCANNFCTCNGNDSYAEPITITCMANGFPIPSVKWRNASGEFPGPDFVVTHNENYSCIATNTYGGEEYIAELTVVISGCLAPPTKSTTTHSATMVSNSTTSSPIVTTTPPTPISDALVGPIVGAVIGVFVIANVVATGLFFWYYKRDEVSHSGKFERNNKLRLDRRFPWLKKMFPCVSDTKESAGSNCLWVSLFILLGTVTGIVTFPIWIILAKKYEKNNETSALTRRDTGEGNGNGENGRRPANISSANHSQPPPANQMNANRREDPYQNESSRENIELNNSHRSRNQLLSDSPQSRPTPAGRPPPPPNKPTINMSTGRSKDYTVNDETPANPEHTTYADLPFVPRNTLPTATPVQFLNVSNDTYAALNKT